jgi:2-iminobutanoate/2-iminopropanoate deaminase
MNFKNPDTIHQPLASYSHQAEVSADSSWLVLSGQIGMDKNGNVPADVIEQTKIALDNIKENLLAANLKKENLVKLIFYFVGTHDSEQRKKLFSEYFGEHMPCMTVIFVAGLASPALKIEIDAWACSI